MHAGQILSATQEISDTFLITAQSMIIVKGTINAAYTVESRDRNSSDAWELDGSDAQLTSDENRVVWQGSPELEYRLNLMRDRLPLSNPPIAMCGGKPCHE